MSANLAVSPYTKDLFKQYKKQLGIIRYHLLKEAQILVMPESKNNAKIQKSIPSFSCGTFIQDFFYYKFRLDS